MSQAPSFLEDKMSATTFVGLASLARGGLAQSGFGQAMRLSYKSEDRQAVARLVPFLSVSKPHYLVQGRYDWERLKAATARIVELGSRFGATCSYGERPWLFTISRDPSDLRSLSLWRLKGGDMPQLPELAQAAAARGIPIAAGKSRWSDGTQCQASLGALSRLNLRESAPGSRLLDDLVPLIVSWLDRPDTALGSIKTWPASASNWISEGLLLPDSSLEPFVGIELNTGDWTSNVELDLLPGLGPLVDQSSGQSLGFVELLALSKDGRPLAGVHCWWQRGEPGVRSFSLGDDKQASREALEILSRYFS